MAWRCPTCKKVYRGKNACNRAKKCCKNRRQEKHQKGKGYSKTVYTVKFSKGPGR